VIIIAAVLTCMISAQAVEHEEIKRGQKAYGLTVFADDKVEKFDLELVGVLDNFLGPKQDLILAKLTDPRLEQAGVVAGMSGSPVYFNGKLLGSLGYALGTFMKEGYCGITPIAAMREVRDLPRRDPFVAAHCGSAVSSVLPIAAPLSVGGVDSEVLRYFAPIFEKMGFVVAPTATGSGNAEDHSSTDSLKSQSGLKPGDAVSAELVRGDVTVAATGTVTSVDGSHVLAFGHPFLGAGAITLPMAATSILAIIPSFQRSFKLGQVGKKIGTFTQDRLTAMSGELGLAAQILPVKVEVREEEHQPHRYEYEVARDPKLTPELVQLVLASSFARQTDAGVVGTAALSAQVTLVDGNLLELHENVAMDRDLSVPILAALTISRSIDLLWHNDFGPPLVKAMSVKADLSRVNLARRIDVLQVRNSRLAPGENLSLRVGLRTENEPLHFEEISVLMTSPVTAGDYELTVCSANEANQIENRIGGPAKPQSADELIQALRGQRTNGFLYVLLVGRGPSLRVGETLLTKVPLSFATQMISGEGDQRLSHNPESIVLEQNYQLLGVVMGSAQASIHIREHR